MHLDTHKELTPVVYGESGVRVLQNNVKLSGRQCFPLHWHDRMELLRVMEGSFDLWVGGEYAGTVRPGQTAVICPRQTHRAVTDSEGTVYNVIMFDVDAFCNAVPAARERLRAVEQMQLQFAPVCSHPQVIDALDRIVEEHEKHPLNAIGAVYQLFGALFTHGDVRESGLRAADARFGEVIAFVNRHYTEPISAASLSADFGYDESYFCRRFRQTTGLTVMNYILILRLELAEQLLRKTACSVSEVARQCGFSEPCHFSRRFRAHFGFPPSAVRK